MRKFLNWLYGMVEVRIGEDQIERFLNLCRNRELQLYQIAHHKTEYCFQMRLSDYWRIRPVAKKIGVLPLVSGRKGLPFWLGEWSRRKVFTGGFLLFALLLFFLTRMIWSIDIEGCSYHTEEALLKFLEKQGVHCGMFYRDLDYKRTEDLIRLTYQDISWVSVERVGTKLHIRLKESELVDTAIEEKKPADLIASRDGIVESIVTRSGTPMVEAGDEVKKGDVLISGIVEVTGDYDAPLSTHLVYADGDVILTGTQGYHSVLELEYQEKVYTGKEQKRISLRGFGYQVDFFTWENKGEAVDRLTEQKKLYLNPSLAFPISLLTTTCREYSIVRLRYREEEAIALEEKKLADYLANLEEEEISVLGQEVTITVGRTVCVAKGTIQTRRMEKRHRSIQEEPQKEPLQ